MRNSACVHLAEMPVDTDRIKYILARQQRIYHLFKFASGQRSVHPQGLIRFKEGHGREGSALLHTYLSGAAVRVQMIEASVEGNHLAVQLMECPDAEIPIFFQLAETD
ncbi:hypothetical protein D3C73_500250 [compost metagenome]